MFADSGSHDEMVSATGEDLLPRQEDEPCEVGGVDWCERSREGFEGIVGWLADRDVGALEHGEVESPSSVRGVLFRARAGVDAGVLSTGVAQPREFVGQYA